MREAQALTDSATHFESYAEMTSISNGQARRRVEWSFIASATRPPRIGKLVNSRWTHTSSTSSGYCDRRVGSTEVKTIMPAEITLVIITSLLAL
jgi:hypothetical protein